MVERKKTNLRKARAAVSNSNRVWHVSVKLIECDAENLGQAVEYLILELYVDHIIRLYHPVISYGHVLSPVQKSTHR